MLLDFVVVACFVLLCLAGWLVATMRRRLGRPGQPWSLSRDDDRVESNFRFVAVRALKVRVRLRRLKINRHVTAAPKKKIATSNGSRGRAAWLAAINP